MQGLPRTQGLWREAQGANEGCGLDRMNTHGDSESLTQASESIRAKNNADYFGISLNFWGQHDDTLASSCVQKKSSKNP